MQQSLHRNPMHKTTWVDLQSPDDPKILTIAAKVRMQLLQFRFEHYHTLWPAKIPAGRQLCARTLDLYRKLSLALAADEEARWKAARLVAEQRQFQPSLLTPPQASAVRVLYASVHDNPTTGSFLLRGLKTARTWTSRPVVNRPDLVSGGLAYLDIAQSNEPEPGEPRKLCVVGQPCRPCAGPPNGR